MRNARRSVSAPSKRTRASASFEELFCRGADLILVVIVVIVVVVVVRPFIVAVGALFGVLSPFVAHELQAFLAPKAPP